MNRERVSEKRQKLHPQYSQTLGCTLTMVLRNMITLLLLLPLQTLSADTQRLGICYNYGCNNRGTITLAEEDINLLHGLFRDLSSAEDERKSIRQAIASLEQIAGRYLPTENDVGGNYQKEMAENGQMDCIDESTNTTTYLTFLQQQGLLRWHNVEKRVFRAPLLFDQHWAAQIRERESGQRYVVDSWFKANGEPPLILPLDDWQKKTRKYLEIIPKQTGQ